MADIRLETLRREFDGGVVAVDDLSLTFSEGSVTCLLGPSGCGKTTLLRMIAGLEQPTSGRILFGDQDVTMRKTRERDLGMVFQYPVVYRGTTIRENLALPLRREQLTKSEKVDRVEEVLSLLGLEDSGDTSVSDLDNATRQKVAVARAITRRPPIVLFDEPITNVDIHAKLQLKQVLKELFTTLKQTVLYVTHDQTEAMTLADQIALMRDGHVDQLAAPRELYASADSVFAGWFLGNPGMNFVELAAAPDLVMHLLKNQLSNNVVSVGFRPEDVELHDDVSSGGVAATVEHIAIVTGGQRLATLQCKGQTLKAKLPWNAAIKPEAGNEVWCTVDPSKIRAFDVHERAVEVSTIS